MAATILTVGFMGLIQAVTITSGMMDTARRQTLAAQILEHEIEQLRFKSWAYIQGLPDLPPTTIDSINFPNSPFLSAVTASGAIYSLSSTSSYIDPSTSADTGTDTGLREVTFTVTWVVTTSRHDDSGNLVTFTSSRVNSAHFSKYGLNLTYQRS